LGALNSELERQRDALSLSKVVGDIPVINMDTEHTVCPVCGTGLVVEKVKVPRKVFTVAYGELGIRERVKKCPGCGGKYRSVDLPEIVEPGCNYAYDCIVEAGRLRFIEKRQITEIQSIFDGKYHLQVSCTQLRRLVYGFLYYLGRLHYQSTRTRFLM